ncbi:MAG: hypothetical protein HKO59_00255 [Phycisphaerales bacterium]|nr:hypothetical protein [Phycisphaerae bacterium]NNF44524.1 hypothetical protein [Phycisphaerales bacterium]NNM24413.1 hypothetical protein [Phycisphaerales bacterium]
MATERRANLNGPLTLSVLCLAAVGLLLGMTLPPLVRAAFTSGELNDALDNQFVQLLDEHEKELETYQSRFNGRSIFFEPPVRRVERPVRPTPPSRTTGSTPAPPPPVVAPRKPQYSGPAVKGFAGGKVWFAGDMRIGLGEKQSGLEVIEVDAPWKVVIKYGGWEYELPLFNRNEELFATPTSTARVDGLEVIEGPTSRPATDDPSSADGPRGDDETDANEAGDDTNKKKDPESVRGTRTAGSADTRGGDAAEPRRPSTARNDD